jgi:hypothetical protein
MATDKDILGMLQRIRDAAKNVSFIAPAGKSEAECEQILVTDEMRLLTEDYLAMIYETNALNRKLMADINSLKKELHEERAATATLEKKLIEYNTHHPSATINRRMFSLYVQSVHDRDATEAEWHDFAENFHYNSLQFNSAIYKWIDTRIEAVKLTEALPMTPPADDN